MKGCYAFAFNDGCNIVVTRIRNTLDNSVLGSYLPVCTIFEHLVSSISRNNLKAI